MTDVVHIRSRVTGTASDDCLIEACRAGDSEAYAELYRRHLVAALGAARALTRSGADVDDLVSEAFARVWRLMRAGQGPQVAFRPYLLRAVHNLFVDRVCCRREDAIGDLYDEVDVASLDAAADGPDCDLAAAALALLPARWRAVLRLTVLDECSAADVAPLLELAPNTVAALKYRALEGLRQAYLLAHLRHVSDPACRECVARLAAYVRDGLSSRGRQKVDAHLTVCRRCTTLLAEVREVNALLRAADRAGTA